MCYSQLHCCCACSKFAVFYSCFIVELTFDLLIFCGLLFGAVTVYLQSINFNWYYYLHSSTISTCYAKHISKYNQCMLIFWLLSNRWCWWWCGCRSYLFWTDCGTRPKIERVELDGSTESRHEVVTTDIRCPVGLTIGALDFYCYAFEQKFV